jgi:hypothetical protein
MTGWEGDLARLAGHGIGRLRMARRAKWVGWQVRQAQRKRGRQAGMAMQGKGVTEACRESMAGRQIRERHTEY